MARWQDDPVVGVADEPVAEPVWVSDPIIEESAELPPMLSPLEAGKQATDALQYAVDQGVTLEEAHGVKAAEAVEVAAKSPPDKPVIGPSPWSFLPWPLGEGQEEVYAEMAVRSQAKWDDPDRTYWEKVFGTWPEVVEEAALAAVTLTEFLAATPPGAVGKQLVMRYGIDEDTAATYERHLVKARKVWEAQGAEIPGVGRVNPVKMLLWDIPVFLENLALIPGGGAGKAVEPGARAVVGVIARNVMRIGIAGGNTSAAAVINQGGTPEQAIEAWGVGAAYSAAFSAMFNITLAAPALKNMAQASLKSRALQKTTQNLVNEMAQVRAGKGSVVKVVEYARRGATLTRELHPASAKAMNKILRNIDKRVAAINSWASERGIPAEQVWREVYKVGPLKIWTPPKALVGKGAVPLPAGPPAVQPPPAVGVPMMVTKAMKVQLGTLGYTAEQIGAMAPTQVQQVLAGAVAAPVPPAPAEAPPPPPPEAPRVAPAPPVGPPVAAEGVVPAELVPATGPQRARAHALAKEKAFISEKGKMRQGYRRLAKNITGQTSMKNMTKDEASAFIDALQKLPRPTVRKGKLVPPSIPKTMRVTVPEAFEKPYKKPTIFGGLTPQTYYAEILGVKPLVAPLEKATQEKALEFARLSQETDKQIQQVDKLGKTTLAEKAAAKVKNRPTKAVARMRDLLDKHEEPPAELSAEEKAVFVWFRNLTRETLLRENTIRQILGLPVIPTRQAYVRHVASGMAQEMIDGKYPFPENLKYWSERVVGKRVFNPMEMQRKLADELAEKVFTKDLAFATKSMLWTALKEIHLSEPLRFFNEQMAAVAKDMPIYDTLSPAEQDKANRITTMPAETRRWVTEYVNVTMKGQMSALDHRINAIVTETALRGVLEKLLRPFGRTLSRAPVTHFFQKMGRAQMMGVLGWRPKLIIRNKFQLTQNLALYSVRANLRGFMPATKPLQSLLDKSLFLKSYTGLEGLPSDVLGKLEKGWQAGYMWSAISNARTAMKVAYWDTLDLIEKAKYKDFGWADPQRTYTEPREFLYPSERVKILREMEFGAGATQYQYTPIGMPTIFKHKGLIPATRLQSWWMNHWFRFHREAVTRFLSGKSGWSDGAVRLPWSRRIGWLRYLVLGGIILNSLGYYRSYLFGTAPWGAPPFITFMLGLYNYLILGLGQNDERRKAEGKYQLTTSAVTFIPGYLGVKDAATLAETLWTGGDWTQYFFYKKGEEKRPSKGAPLRRRAKLRRKK